MPDVYRNIRVPGAVCTEVSVERILKLEIQRELIFLFPDRCSALGL